MKLPAGWSVVVLDDVLTSSEYGTSAPAIENGTRPVVGMKDLQGGRVLLSDLGHVDEDLQDWSKLELRLGDILLNRTNSPHLVGKIGIVDQGTNAVFASYLVRLNADRSVVDPYFLNYWMNGPEAQRAIKRTATRGVSQANINPTVLRQHCPVVLPPLAEQHKIAEILHTWDDAIEGLSALRVAALQQRDWLRLNLIAGSSRLPNAGKWKLAPLSEVLHEHRNRSTGIEPVYSVSVHKGLVNQIEHLGRSFAAKNTAHYNRVSPGDVVYTKSPTGDFPLGIVRQSRARKDVLVSPLYGVFSPVSYEIGTMLSAYFESPALTQRYLHPLVQKGAKNTIAITNSRFLEGLLALPVDRNEQKAIAEVMNDSALQIRVIEQERSQLIGQKRGLMQQLLTGEMRVTGDGAESSGGVSIV